MEVCRNNMVIISYCKYLSAQRIIFLVRFNLEPGNREVRILQTGHQVCYVDVKCAIAVQNGLVCIKCPRKRQKG